MEHAGHSVDDRQKRGKQGESDRWDVDHALWYKTWYRTGLDRGGMSVSGLLFAANLATLHARVIRAVQSSHGGVCMHAYAGTCARIGWLCQHVRT